MKINFKIPILLLISISLLSCKSQIEFDSKRYIS